MVQRETTERQSGILNNISLFFYLQVHLHHGSAGLLLEEDAAVVVDPNKDFSSFVVLFNDSLQTEKESKNSWRAVP